MCIRDRREDGVVVRAQHLAGCGVHEDRADRDLVVGRGGGRLGEREAHEALVVVAVRLGRGVRRRGPRRARAPRRRAETRVVNLRERRARGMRARRRRGPRVRFRPSGASEAQRAPQRRRGEHRARDGAHRFRRAPLRALLRFVPAARILPSSELTTSTTDSVRETPASTELTGARGRGGVAQGPSTPDRAGRR